MNFKHLLLSFSCLILTASTAGFADPIVGVNLLPFELKDQFGQSQLVTFPHPQKSILILADRKGADQTEFWKAQLTQDIDPQQWRQIGVAALGEVPRAFRWIAKKTIQKRHQSLLLDWNNTLASQLSLEKGQARIVILDETGQIIGAASGPFLSEKYRVLAAQMQASQ